MAEAAAKTNLHYNTFCRYAKKLNVYRPNQGALGKKKPKRNGYGKIATEDILNGKFPGYQTFKLKHKLYNDGLKVNKCEICGISEWRGKIIQCELDHIDGDSKNHKLENLRILCPNCHSQTENFRAKNIKK